MNTDNTSNHITGNKCGHNAESPKIYTQPTFFKKRPALLSRAKFRANNVATGRSWHNPQYLHHYKSQRRRDVSLRQMRSEGRSRFSQVAGAIIDHLDLETMQLGRWDTKSGMFCPYSWAEILGILTSIQGDHENFSRDRMYQELRRFVATGYLRVQKRHYATGEQDDNGRDVVRQDVAHKWVCVRLFEDLGISKEDLELARKASSKRNDQIRMNAAVAQCANNPTAKPAEAIALMVKSAREGSYSKVRQYFEQKRAEIALKRASETTTNPPKKTSNRLSESERAAKIRFMMEKGGLSRERAEAYINRLK